MATGLKSYTAVCGKTDCRTNTNSRVYKERTYVSGNYRVTIQAFVYACRTHRDDEDIYPTIEKVWNNHTNMVELGKGDNK